MENLADIGVFGGSGFYKFLEDIKEVPMDTPYGMPSDNLFVGKIGNHKVAFMPRHGKHSKAFESRSQSSELRAPCISSAFTTPHKQTEFSCKQRSVSSSGCLRNPIRILVSTITITTYSLDGANWQPVHLYLYK